MGHAHVYRIRLDAEGVAASDIERTFLEWVREFERGTGTTMHVVQQVIELADAKKAESFGPADGADGFRGVWFKGRMILAADLRQQGCDEVRGDRVAYGDASVPAVLVTE